MIGGAHVLYSDNSYHGFIFVGILCVLYVLGHFILFSLSYSQITLH